MRWKALCGCLIVIGSLLDYSAKGAQYAFEVTFTDKNNTPYTLSNPLDYLSARALARRANQGIAVDSTDIPVNRTYIDTVLSLTGGTLHGTSRWLNMCMILLTDSTQILNLAGKPYISNIKLVGYYSTNLHRNGANNNIATQRTTTGSAYYGNTWTQTQVVNGSYLHDAGFKGQGKLIAVLDEGFTGVNTHPGFDSMWLTGRLIDTFNFTFGNKNVFTQGTHGTEVFSTIAGNIPGTYVGCAPNAEYALYITEYAADEQPLELDNMLCAVEHADSLGVDVITESLGYDLFDYPTGAGQNFATDLDGKTTIGARAANIATKKGILFVATAGNDGNGIIGWGNHILTPGDADSALTIGNVNSSGVMASSSGYGPNAAGHIKPDVCGMGQNVAVFTSWGGFSTADGTSLSTPQIAGWAACLWQSRPYMTPYQVKESIRKCASRYNTPGNQTGYGIANFECSALEVRTPLLPSPPMNWVTAVNPFDNELEVNITANADALVTLELMDMNGKKILSQNIYASKNIRFAVAISTTTLPAGIYILHALSATEQQVLKVQKQ